MNVRFSESDMTMNLRFNRGSASMNVGFSENDRTLSTDFKENDVIPEEVMFGETDRRMTVGFGEIQTAGGAGTPGKNGLSAYEIAVKNGFKGSEKEWLESLKASGSNVTIGVVNLLADKWVGSGSLFSQIVSIEGVTKHSQVDLTPSVEQLVVFYEKDISFVTENDGGIVTVYVIGQKPENDYTIQVTITEVMV